MSDQALTRRQITNAIVRGIAIALLAVFVARLMDLDVHPAVLAGVAGAAAGVSLGARRRAPEEAAPDDSTPSA